MRDFLCLDLVIRSPVQENLLISKILRNCCLHQQLQHHGAMELLWSWLRPPAMTLSCSPAPSKAGGSLNASCFQSNTMQFCPCPLDPSSWIWQCFPAWQAAAPSISHVCWHGEHVWPLHCTHYARAQHHELSCPGNWRSPLNNRKY